MKSTIKFSLLTSLIIFLATSNVFGQQSAYYVPKFNSSLSLVNSLIYDSSYVGIGTTLPGAPLQVNGSGATSIFQNTNASSYGGIRLYNNLGSNVRSLEIDYAGSSYSGALVTGGPTGESASLTTTGAWPLTLGTNNTMRMTILASGYVGIGTGTPTNPLTVSGNGNFTGTVTAPTFYVGNSNTALSQGTVAGYSNALTVSSYVSASKTIFLANTAGIWAANSGGTYNSIYYTDPSNNLDFGDFNSNFTGGLKLYTGGAARVTVLNGGNVGIGTTGPNQALDVNGSILSENNNALYWRNNTQINASSPVYGIGISNTTFSGSPATRISDFYGLLLATNDTDRIAVSTNGKVGIGTTAPTANLNVIANNGDWSYGIISAASTNNTKALSVQKGGNDKFVVYGNGEIIAYGNVLVAKTSQVDTAYHLDVAGGIRADSVVVNTTGADFVFDDNYQKMSLDELGKYIAQHKHLPDIASAQEMQKDGVSVGALQTKLLQKVEELTLYVIEQNKRIEKLEKENAELRSSQ